jgi:uncharacterized protein
MGGSTLRRSGSRNRSGLLVTTACIAMLLGTIPGANALTVPDPGMQVVVDTASVMDATSLAQATTVLEELNQATDVQVKILTIPSLEGGDLVDFTQHEFDLWKLGTKGKDDGVLIVFARDDRKVRIEPGYGLEGVLTDAWCGESIRAVIDQSFRQQNYGAGLDALAQAVAMRIAQDHGYSLTTTRGPALAARPALPSHQVLLWMVIIGGCFILRRVVTGSWSRPSRPWTSGYGGFGGGGGGFGGGGFSGGGGGGFSGGGGSSGGGGASGGW